MRSKNSPESEQEEKPSFFDEVWKSLETVFRSTLKSETKVAWQRQLGHIPEYAVKAAAKSICQNEDKMPSLAMIIRYTRNHISKPSFPLHSEGEDDAGVKCWYWADEGGQPAYKAADCPEGRAFLSALKKLAVKKDMNKALEEAQQKKAPFEITPEIVEKVIRRGRK
jgi:hypothetical protein